MKVSYFPGCSLHGTAREYDESARAVARILGVELQELDGWNCCGAASAHSTSDSLSVAIAGRNLELAERAGMDLVVPCAACYQRLKAAEKRLAREPAAEEVSVSYQGNVRIKHLISFFSEGVDAKAIKAKVKRPLHGLKPVCYYGCLTVRPPKVTDAPNWEDPQAMDLLLILMGADVKNWSYKTDCCGGDLSFMRRDLTRKLVRKLFDMAEEAGADCIVTGCPLCQSNLDTYQKDIAQEAGKQYHVPIFYFTELMGLALGDTGAKKWFGRHLTDPTALLQQRGLV